jgi:hypothetical protein
MTYAHPTGPVHGNIACLGSFQQGSEPGMPSEADTAFGKRDQRTFSGTSLGDMRGLLPVDSQSKVAKSLLFNGSFSYSKGF